MQPITLTIQLVYFVPGLPLAIIVVLVLQLEHAFVMVDFLEVHVLNVLQIFTHSQLALTAKPLQHAVERELAIL